MISVCSCVASPLPGLKGTSILWPAFAAAFSIAVFPAKTIKSAIENEDIERIVFYSLLQIPKKHISIADNISKDDPLKRAPYFGIMHIHHLTSF